MKNLITDLTEVINQYWGQILFLVVLFLGLSLATNTFLTRMNLINVLRQLAPNMYIACAITMILVSGGIDLSSPSVMAFAGLVSGGFSYLGLPFWICLIAGLLSGALAGLVNGVLVANTTMPPFIVTYAMSNVLRGAVYVISSANVWRLRDRSFIEFGGGSLGIIPWPVVYMFAVVVAAYLILNKSQLGRHMFAVGGNAKAALYAGVNIKRVRMFVYTAAGLMSALAGIVYTSRSVSMQPTLGTHMEMDAIAAVVLGGTSMGGGRGGMIGTIIGVCVIGMINNGLNLLRFDTFWQYIIKGIVILVAVYVDDVRSRKDSAGSSVSVFKKIMGMSK